jgi:chromosome segregation ATPase
MAKQSAPVIPTPPSPLDTEMAAIMDAKHQRIDELNYRIGQAQSQINEWQAEIDSLAGSVDTLTAAYPVAASLKVS